MAHRGNLDGIVASDRQGHVKISLASAGHSGARYTDSRDVVKSG
jgi:hypothetical protein